MLEIFIETTSARKIEIFKGIPFGHPLFDFVPIRPLQKQQDVGYNFLFGIDVISVVDDSLLHQAYWWVDYFHNAVQMFVEMYKMSHLNIIEFEDSDGTENNSKIFFPFLCDF